MDSSDVPVIETSQWPLPRDGRRIVVPQALIQTLGAHPLCGDCLQLNVVRRRVVATNFKPRRQFGCVCVGKQKPRTCGVHKRERR